MCNNKSPGAVDTDGSQFDNQKGSFDTFLVSYQLRSVDNDPDHLSEAEHACMRYPRVHTHVPMDCTLNVVFE